MESWRSVFGDGVHVRKSYQDRLRRTARVHVERRQPRQLQWNCATLRGSPDADGLSGGSRVHDMDSRRSRNHHGLYR